MRISYLASDLAWASRWLTVCLRWVHRLLPELRRILPPGVTPVSVYGKPPSCLCQGRPSPHLCFLPDGTSEKEGQAPACRKGAGSTTLPQVSHLRPGDSGER